ncbi:hypothetical protein K1719_013690 [Acacia pycnantha]|nr:hypothetical protein K1719_013690 [Acacia pycnantha]
MDSRDMGSGGAIEDWTDCSAFEAKVVHDQDYNYDYCRYDSDVATGFGVGPFEDGLLRVILDGGPSRVFFPADAKLLQEDLEVLKEFFISGGDGLPRGIVENQVARVRDVIKLHGYETRELVEDLKSASGMEMPGGKSRLGADSKTLIRILYHRSDSEASQFLKK